MLNKSPLKYIFRDYVMATRISNYELHFSTQQLDQRPSSCPQFFEKWPQGD